MKILRAVKESTADYEKIEERIKAFYRKFLYAPLLRELELPYKLENANLLSLEKALKRGTVTYHRGKFSGYFDASVSKELRSLGAKWDKKASTFNIPKAELPPTVRASISVSQAHFEAKLKKIDADLAKKLPVISAETVKTSDLFNSTLKKVDRELLSTLPNIVRPPALTPSRSERLSKEWQDNLDLWIKDFTEEQIKDLRKTVMESAFSGNRYESLVGVIEKSYGVTKRKAKFLARQETALLMTKFKESRYTDSGITKYIWTCVAGSKKHPVRPAHKILDGKMFSFDAPPVTTAPGEPQRRNNPGEDYNCRCFSRPVINFRE